MSLIVLSPHNHRPYVFKIVMLEQVCEELVRLSSYGIGKVVMKTGEPLR
jgi:hypothetical protein